VRGRLKRLSFLRRDEASETTRGNASRGEMLDSAAAVDRALPGLDGRGCPLSPSQDPEIGAKGARTSTVCSRLAERYAEVVGSLPAGALTTCVAGSSRIGAVGSESVTFDTARR
jgi:hypothetical protein